jgi:hypothetical protein
MNRTVTTAAIAAGLAVSLAGAAVLINSLRQPSPPPRQVAPAKPAPVKPAIVPSPPPQPAVIPAPAPIKVEPAPLPKIEPAPNVPPMPPMAAAPAAVSPAAETPAAAVPLPKVRPVKHRRRRRVEYEPGGPALDCGLVRFAVRHFSQAQIDVLEKQNAVTPQQRAAARRCLRSR